MTETPLHYEGTSATIELIESPTWFHEVRTRVDSRMSQLLGNRDEEAVKELEMLGVVRQIVDMSVSPMQTAEVGFDYAKGPTPLWVAKAFTGSDQRTYCSGPTVLRAFEFMLGVERTRQVKIALESGFTFRAMTSFNIFSDQKAG